MRVVSSAPGRVNLIGEHTDYNRGVCLPLALSQRTTVTLTTRTDGRLRMTSAQEDDAWEGTVADRPDGWPAYVAGVVAALQDDGFDVPGFDATIESEVPVGGGVSSSAALECAVATGLAKMLDLELTEEVRRQLAAACVRAENDYVGAPTGGMDQTIAMLARPGHALLLDFADDSWTPILLPLVDAGLTLVVIDTRVRHRLTDGSYGDRRAECAEAASALGLPSLRDADAVQVEQLDDPVLRRRARHVVTENQRVRDAVDALEERDWERLAELLDASHVSMRDDFEISCRELDLAVDTARSAGALGARMTGGGFGGSAVALVRTDDVRHVRDSVEATFGSDGLSPPGFLLAEPGDAARVEPQRG